MNWPKCANYADYADHADNAEYAEYAENAGYAGYAESAEFAEYAKYTEYGGQVSNHSKAVMMRAIVRAYEIYHHKDVGESDDDEEGGWRFIC